MQTESQNYTPSLRNLSLPRLALEQVMTLDEVEKAVKEEIANGNAGQYRIGELYNHVVLHSLAELAGYKNASHFFNERVQQLSQSTLSLYGAMARRFSEPVCTRYGMYALSLLVRYADKAGLVELPVDPSAVPIIIPIGPTGDLVEKPFSQCSVTDLKAALQSTGKPEATPPSDEHKALHRRLAILMDRAFPKGHVRTRLHEYKGTPCLSFNNVPVDELLRLADTLRQGVALAPVTN